MESSDSLDLDAAIARWRISAALDDQTLDELEAHLRDAFAASMADGHTASEAFSRALAQLGDSAQLTSEFSKLKHPSLMTTTSACLRSPRLRRLARQAILAVAVTLVVRTFILTPYRAVGASVAPEIPAGGHVLAWRVAPRFTPGDIAVYREDARTYLGRVTAVAGTTLTVVRANQPERSVTREAIIGRVVATTR